MSVFQFATAEPQRTAPAMGGSAGDMLAQLTREQWNTYIQQFVPVENTLINYAMNPAAITEARERAVTGVGEQFDIAQQSAARRRRGMGIVLNPDEQKAADRQANLGRSLAEVGASNTARDMVVDRQRSIMGMPGTAPLGA